MGIGDYKREKERSESDCVERKNSINCAPHPGCELILNNMNYLPVGSLKIFWFTTSQFSDKSNKYGRKEGFINESFRLII